MDTKCIPAEQGVSASRPFPEAAMQAASRRAANALTLKTAPPRNLGTSGPDNGRPDNGRPSTEPRRSAGPHEHPELRLCNEATGFSFHGMAGRSPGMRRFFGQIQVTAPHLRIATLEGEDGTGKTLAARIIHGLGPSSRGPFVQCLASVFVSDRHAALALPWCPSLSSQSAGGMLFLDRLDELDLQQQERLFEFLLWIDNQPDGDHGPAAPPRQVVVSSTHSLRRMAAMEGFRGDLCSRLTAIRLVLPPLRDRREDIPLLAQFFAQRFAQTFRKPIRGLAPDALPPLLRHPWPGNVRELESVITAAALQTESQWIRFIDLPLLTANGAHEGQPAENDFNLDRVIARHVERTLERTRGNKLRAALILGISRSTLYRILGSS